MFRKGHAAALSRTIVILSLYVLSYTFIPIEAGVHVLHVYSSIGRQKYYTTKQKSVLQTILGSFSGSPQNIQIRYFLKKADPITLGCPT